jgi:hypothetical protein
MSRARAVVVVSSAALALSVCVASSAQAGWLVLGSLLVGSAAVAPTTVTDVNPTVTVAGFKVVCSKLTINAGKISEPDKLLASSFEDSGCEVIEPPSCRLANSTIDTLPVEGLATLDGKLAVKSKIKPENSNDMFATVKIEGSSCSDAGKVAVTGSWEVLAPEGQDLRLSEKFIAFDETAGELEIASSPATISAAILGKVEDEMPWAFQ